MSIRVEDIVARYIAGESIRMLSEDTKIDRQKLSCLLHSNGVEVRSKREAAGFTWKNHTHPRLGKTGENCPMFGKKLAEKTKQKIRAANTGKNNYHWSGGRKIHSGGYVLVYCPDHSAADKNGFVLEHRLVYEKHLNRRLSSDEIIHHINGIKLDNRLENLKLTNRRDHALLHQNFNQRRKNVI